MGSKKDFRFNYYKYRSRSALTPERLDRLIDLVLGETSNTSTLSKIWAGIQLVLALAFIFARKFLLDEQAKVDRQVYEQERVQDIEDDLEGDSLDTELRNP